MNNIGELFKILNLEICNKFYENVNDDNKKDIIDNMINNEEFMSLVNPIMNDLDMLKIKIDTKLSAIIKKNMKDIIKPIKEEKPINTHDLSITNLNKSCENCTCENCTCENCTCENCTCDNCTCENCTCENCTCNNEEKGNHIGGGIYLKKIDHLIKMTTSNFVCYY